MSENLFLIATRNGYRFPTERGHLNVEQLWDLPLLDRRSNFDLNSVATAINTQLRALAEESFVNVEVTPERTTLQRQLDLVKEIIAIKQAEAAAATERAAAESLKAQLREAIAARRSSDLASTPLEELEAQLAALTA
jgi:hypothetical protein